MTDFMTGYKNWTKSVTGLQEFGKASGSYLPTLHTNKRLSQQPALGALTFLRSFIAGKANFCSHLLASLEHFTVVKSQAILIIRLGVTEVIYNSFWGCRSYFCRNFTSSANFKMTKFLPRWIGSGTTILHVDSAYR